jgi:hypothetical protein
MIDTKAVKISLQDDPVRVEPLQVLSRFRRDRPQSATAACREHLQAAVFNECPGGPVGMSGLRLPTARSDDMVRRASYEPGQQVHVHSGGVWSTPT